MFAICFVSICIGAGPGIEDVVAALQDREKAVRSFSVVCEFEQAFGSEASRRGRETICGDTTGRLRVVRETADERGFNVGEQQVLQVFDGTSYRTLTSEKQRPLAGKIGARPKFTYVCGDPWELITKSFGKPTSTQVAANAKIAERIQEKDRVLTVVETTPYYSKERRRQERLRLWLDGGHGFPVIREVCEACYDGRTEWVAYSVREFSEFVEASPGIWVAQRYLSEGYETSPGERRLFARVRASLRDWKMNIELPASLFELTFPVGIGVTDETTGSTYRVSKVTENDVKSEVERAHNLLKQQGESGGSATVIVASLLVLSAAVVGSVLRFRKRHQASGSVSPRVLR